MRWWCREKGGLLVSGFVGSLVWLAWEGSRGVVSEVLLCCCGLSEEDVVAAPLGTWSCDMLASSDNRGEVDKVFDLKDSKFWYLRSADYLSALQ